MHKKDLISELIRVLVTKRTEAKTLTITSKLICLSEPLDPVVEKAALNYMSQASEVITSGIITPDENLGICLNILTLVQGLMTDEGTELFTKYLDETSK